MSIRASWEALLDLALPQFCDGCDRPGPAPCASCMQLLTTPLGLWLPTPTPAGLPTLAAAAPYDGPVRAMLLAHKENGRLLLSAPLGAALAGAVLELPSLIAHASPLLLVPVPSARAAVRARGHDHAFRLARAAAGELRRRDVSASPARLLTAARRVEDQS
ncbi:MAG TPA: ComF family protein, partial [Mycobacteriales bacterium]|nr:ComF family protein [Mycobacteriales bacterium]